MSEGNTACLQEIRFSRKLGTMWHDTDRKWAVPHAGYGSYSQTFSELLRVNDTSARFKGLSV